MVRVVRGVEAAGTEDATVIEGTIPGESLLVRSQPEKRIVVEGLLAPKTALSLFENIPAGPPWNWRIIERSTGGIEARLYIR